MNFTLDITLANIITLVLLIVTIIIAWQKLKDKTDFLDKQVSRIQAGFDEQKKVCAETIACRQTQYGQLLGQLSVIQNDIKWIKLTLGEHQQRPSNTKDIT